MNQFGSNVVFTLNELLKVIFLEFYRLNLAKCRCYVHKEVEPAPFSVDLKHFVESADRYHALQNRTQIKIEGENMPLFLK